MRNFTIYLSSLLCLFLTKSFGQETFEDKAKAIADKIETITKEEKETLKLEIEAVNAQLENGSITNAQADDKKLQLAESRAKSIEYRVAAAKKELDDLVQEKVDGKIAAKETEKEHTISIPGGYKNREWEKWEKENGEKRTTSQLVLAFGFNNLVTDGAVANSDFGYGRSHFFEWGLTLNTRILPNNNLLHFKYGLSFMYNTLHATDNRYFVDAGKQTVMMEYPLGLRAKDTYFKNVFLTLPLHLEFDFSKPEEKDGKRLFRSHDGFRFGLGGFVGYNTNSKQFLSYKVDGYRIKEEQKGSWNVDDWNYGLSAYVGYGQASLYVKYDLNPMFKDNAVDQHNISAGMRFDFN
ncbi:hypothetical protein [Flavobacterium sp.]|uniref:hypothetical protein n=1 Tax=Flavobacterium sp. TaxID=239 RepID=UPI0039E6DC69